MYSSQNQDMVAVIRNIIREELRPVQYQLNSIIMALSGQVGNNEYDCSTTFESAINETKNLSIKDAVEENASEFMSALNEVTKDDNGVPSVILDISETDVRSDVSRS